MRLEISCNECSLEIAPGESSAVYSRVCSIRDDGVYEFECPNGHRTITVLRTPKHEVLYTIGANALLDGYLRDALASFAASLERYYEFAVRVIARHKGIEPDNFNAAWSSLSKQSERQFGAFVIAWVLETGKPYTSISKTRIENLTRLRNEVIHQGKIPTPSECKNYGKYVLDIAAPVEEVLLSDYEAAHKDECFAHARALKKSSPSPLTVLSIYSVFNTAMKSDRKLEPALKRLEDARKLLQLPIIGTDHTRSRIVTRR